VRVIAVGYLPACTCLQGARTRLERLGRNDLATCDSQ